jgi:hypothetical protein
MLCGDGNNAEYSDRRGMMPCWTVRQVSVEMEKVDIGILKKTLEEMGHRVSEREGALSWDYGQGGYRNGTLTVRSEREVTGIKKNYAAVQMKHNAKRFGWKVKEIGAWEYEVTK